MLKNIKYETKDINEVVLDLAEEIKRGWKLYGFCYPHIEASFGGPTEITVEVTLTNGKWHTQLLRGRVMRMYEYLVSYWFLQEGCLTPSHGTTEIYRKKKIQTLKDISELNKFIEERIEGASNLGIYNFILLGRNEH